MLFKFGIVSCKPLYSKIKCLASNTGSVFVVISVSVSSDSHAWVAALLVPKLVLQDLSSVVIAFLSNVDHVTVHGEDAKLGPILQEIIS